jgi:hypothetical protein
MITFRELNVAKPRMIARQIGQITLGQIVAAADLDDLDAAALALQEAGGITDGGGASYCLPSPDLWERMPITERRQALTAWLAYERALCQQQGAR